MGIVFRQSVKTSIVFAFGAVLGMVVTWLSTKYLAGQQFGFTQDIAYKAIVLSQFLLLGLNNTLGVYIHKYPNDDRKRSLLLSFSFVFPAIIFGIFAVLFYIFQSNLLVGIFQPKDVPLVQQHFKWFPVYTLLFIYQLLIEQYLISQMKVAVTAFLREVGMRIANIILILLFGFGHISFGVYFISTIVLYALLLGIYLFLSANTKSFKFSIKPNDFSKEEYADIIRFSWYHFLLNLSISLLCYMDMLLISHYDINGLNSAAIYRVAIQLISILNLPQKALLPASNNVLIQAFAEDDRVKAKDIFNRASINILIPTLCIAVLLCCNLNNAVAVINGYSDIIPVFLILLLGNLVNIAAGMNDQVLSITNHYKFNFYLSLILIVVQFGVLSTLIPLYGIYGAAWGSSLTYVIFNVVKYIFIKRKMNMEPFSRQTLLVLVAAIPAAIAGYAFPYFFEQGRHVYVHTFMDAAMRSTVIIIVYLLMLYWLKPSPDLSDYIASIKKNKRLF